MTKLDYKKIMLMLRTSFIAEISKGIDILSRET